MAVNVSSPELALLVRITRLGNPTAAMALVPGATVGDCLRTANIEVGPGQVVTLNGEQVPEKARVPAGSTIVVVGKVSNG